MDYVYSGICGVGCIIIVNCVYTDIDFFEEELPQMKVAFLFPLLIYSTQVPTQLLSIKYMSRLPLKMLLIGVILVTALVAMSIPGLV